MVSVFYQKELPSTRTVHFQVKDKGTKATTEIILKKWKSYYKDTARWRTKWKQTMKVMDVTGSCEKQHRKIILLPLKAVVFHNTQNCSLTEVNVWKLHCCHKKGHKRMIYSRPIFYLIWLGPSHKCLQLHLNSATWLRHLLQKLLEPFGYGAKIKEIWLIQTWANT